jgi:poly(A) polymerase
MSNLHGLKKIINKISDVAKKHGIHNCYSVGGYTRSLIMDEKRTSVNDIDIASAWPGEATKLGSLAAAEMTNELPEVYHRTGTIKFNYDNVDIEFQGMLGGVYDLQPVMGQLKKYGIEITPINLNIYSRDFTINTLIEDIRTGEMYDITGFGISDIENEIIRTPIDSDVLINYSPITCLRAIRFSLRYNFLIDQQLKSGIDKYSYLLNEKYSPERIQIEILKMLKENYDGTIFYLKEFNLLNLIKNEKYDLYDITSNINIKEYEGDLKNLVQGIK